MRLLVFELLFLKQFLLPLLYIFEHYREAFDYTSCLIICSCLSKSQKSISLYIYSAFRFNWISHFYNDCNYLITRVKFILSFVSNGWLFWSVNHTTITWSSELNVFKKILFYGEISSSLPNDLFGTNVYKTLESSW